MAEKPAGPEKHYPGHDQRYRPYNKPANQFCVRLFAHVLRTFSGRSRIIACRSALPGDRRRDSSCFSLLTPGQEAANCGVATFSKEFVGVPACDHGPGFRVEKNRVVADSEDTC